MNQLQVFENELFKVSAKNDNGQILFDIEQVAKSLGITDTKNGVEYVRWNRVNSYLPKNSPQVAKGDLIPEPLVYKLAFKASNEVAEQFQDWLAIEVIPSIRKTGSYKNKNVVPLSKDQALVTVLRTTADIVEGQHEIVKEQHELRKLVTQIDNKVEEQITLTSGEQRRFQIGVSERVYSFTQDKNEASRLYRELYKEIKNRFGVPSYRDLRRCDLQVALRYVDGWVPRKVV